MQPLFVLMISAGPGTVHLRTRTGSWVVQGKAVWKGREDLLTVAWEPACFINMWIPLSGLLLTGLQSVSAGILWGEKPMPTLSEVRKSKLLSTVQLEVKQKVVTVWKDFVRD